MEFKNFAKWDGLIDQMSNKLIIDKRILNLNSKLWHIINWKLSSQIKCKHTYKSCS